MEIVMTNEGWAVMRTYKRSREVTDSVYIFWSGPSLDCQLLYKKRKARGLPPFFNPYYEVALDLPLLIFFRPP